METIMDKNEKSLAKQIKAPVSIPEPTKTIQVTTGVKAGRFTLRSEF
jgi:hypothetical protein